MPVFRRELLSTKWAGSAATLPTVAHKRGGVKKAMSSMTKHRTTATCSYFSLGAGFFFLSFFRKLRKMKKNPTIL